MTVYLREWREFLNMTQPELGGACDPPLASQRIGDLENHRGSPTVATLERLADALDIPVTDLFRSPGS